MSKINAVRTPKGGWPDRLSKVAPDLALRIRAAERARLRPAALEAATLAIEQTGVADAAVDRAIDLLRRGAVDPAVRDRLRALYERLDEHAFDLEELAERIDPDVYHGRKPAADSPSALAASRAARAAAAATAVWFALDPDPLVAALEATDEAYYACGRDPNLLAAVDRTLGES